MKKFHWPHYLQTVFTVTRTYYSYSFILFFYYFKQTLHNNTHWQVLYEVLQVFIITSATLTLWKLLPYPDQIPRLLLVDSFCLPFLTLRYSFRLRLVWLPCCVCYQCEDLSSGSRSVLSTSSSLTVMDRYLASNL
jgi:hypothetical protein